MERHIDVPEGTRCVDQRIAALAAAQHGVFTRAQAVEAGATRDVIGLRLERARWQRLHRSVYRLAGVPATHKQALMAACFVGGPLAVASHRSAATMRALEGIRFSGCEISVPRSRKSMPEGIIGHRVRDLMAEDVTVVDAIPVTTVARTLIDLGAVVPRSVLDRALDDALRRRLVTVPELLGRMDVLARRGRDGVGILRALLNDREPDDARDSRAELLLERLLLRAGLPPLVPQYRVHDGERTIARVDFAYPELRIAIEVEGYRWHSGLVHWGNDRARWTRLAALGWRIIFVMWKDLNERPDEVVARVWEARAFVHPRET